MRLLYIDLDEFKLPPDSQILSLLAIHIVRGGCRVSESSQSARIEIFIYS